jgi:eukaryotic-like serine/threonine-protein kinase
VLAEMCFFKKFRGAAAQLWFEAFQAQPKLADDISASNRYNAACAAALAGSGEGKDDPPLDNAAKARWRKQAIEWLKAELTARTKSSEGGPQPARYALAKELNEWKADTDLGGIRDAAALAKLPEDEQKACRALWAEVDALQAKCQNSGPKPGD